MSRRPRPRRRSAWPWLASVAALGVLLVAVLPTRTWLGQRADLAATERRLAVLASQNEELAGRVQRLNTDAEIERLARQQYNLVRPGEEAYAILPPPAPPRPRARTQAAERAEERGFWSRVWDGVSFWS